MEVKSNLFEIMQFCFLCAIFFLFFFLLVLLKPNFLKKCKNTWFSHAQSHIWHSYLWQYILQQKRLLDDLREKKKKRCEAPVFVKNTQINEQQYWKVDKIKHCELDEAVRYLCSVSQCSKMYQEGKH